LREEEGKKGNWILGGLYMKEMKIYVVSFVMISPAVEKTLINPILNITREVHRYKIFNRSRFTY